MPTISAQPLTSEEFTVTDNDPDDEDDGAIDDLIIGRDASHWRQYLN